MYPAQEDDVGARSLERVTNRGIEGVGVGMCQGRDMARLDTGRGRPPQRSRLAVVADDDHYTTVDAALCARVDDRLKRRTFV